MIAVTHWIAPGGCVGFHSFSGVKITRAWEKRKKTAAKMRKKLQLLGRNTLIWNIMFIEVMPVLAFLQLKE